MAGRPPAYNDPEELQIAVDSYFTDNDKPTISGLAYHLGFASRQSFYDYEEIEIFTYTIKRARLRMEMYYEEKLTGQYSSGGIFALKNFGWSDKQEVTHELKNELPYNISINYRAPE